MVNGKHGWTEMVEAFIAITLIMSFLIVIVSNNVPETKTNNEIYSLQDNILNKIEKNESLRNSILDVSSLPISWSSESFPSEIKEEINSERPVYLNCSAKMCNVSDECLLDETLETDIYSRSLGIFADKSEYDPKQIRLFCWTNNL